jgi:hypothetical protein
MQAAKGKSWLGEFWRPLAALLLWVVGCVAAHAAPPLLPSLAETRVGGLTTYPVDFVQAPSLLTIESHRACAPPLYDVASDCSVAAKGGAEVPEYLYRGGKTNPGNLTPRPSDNGMLSTRDSLSNPWPLPPGAKPPLPADAPIQVIQTSKLPPGTVHVDGAPFGPMAPGHASIGPNVPAQTVKDAIVETIKP